MLSAAISMARTFARVRGMDRYLSRRQEETRNSLIDVKGGVITGDRRIAEIVSPQLEPVELASTAHWEYSTPARHLAGAAHLLDEPERARRYYAIALEAAGKIRNRPEVALSHLVMAELLLEHYPDETAEAQEHLDTAISEFRDMKMQGHLERALSQREILRA